MTSLLLDVTALPFDQTYVCSDGSIINMRELLESYYDVVKVMAASGLVKNNESFGFAMLAPMTDDEANELDDDVWDRPEAFVWFVGGWGKDRDRYIANAVRKLRALVRNLLDPDDICESTLDLRFINPSFFRDKVDSQNDDGSFSWGDFPWGGAVKTMLGCQLTVISSISALTEYEDDTVARLINGELLKRIAAGNRLLSDD